MSDPKCSVRDGFQVRETEYVGNAGQLEWANRKAREVYGHVQDCWVRMRIEDDELRAVQYQKSSLSSRF